MMFRLFPIAHSGVEESDGRLAGAVESFGHYLGNQTIQIHCWCQIADSLFIDKQMQTIVEIADVAIAISKPSIMTIRSDADDVVWQGPAVPVTSREAHAFAMLRSIARDAGRPARS